MLESWPNPEGGWESWKPLWIGVEYTRSSRTRPRPMKCHALRLDLDASGLEVLVNQPLDGPRETRAQVATGFLRREHLQVAVTTTAFAPIARFPGEALDVVGLAVRDGHCWSPAVPNLDALVITRQRRARIVAARGDISDAWQGAGGNLAILRGGTNVAEKLRAEATSACGVSADGRYLFWLVVDGRQKGWSEGSTAPEAADMLRELGAADALRFDDGSVVTLAMEGPWGWPRVVNRPCHPYVTGVQRPVASFVGIRARALGEVGGGVSGAR